MLRTLFPKNWLVGLVILPVFLLGGCQPVEAPPKTPEVQPASPSVGLSEITTPTPSTSAEILQDPVPTGPLAPYALSSTQRAELVYAFGLLVDECLAPFGYHWNEAELAEHVAVFRQLDTHWLASDYGVYDPDLAYRRPQVNPPESYSNAPHSLLEGERDDLTAPALRTISPGEHNGLTIPPGGCIGEAYRALDDPGGINWGDELPGYWELAVEATAQEPGYEEVVEPWRKCVADAGFTVTDPVSDEADIARIIETRPPQGPTEEELRLARIDIACQEKTGLVAAMTPLREAAQAKILAEHRVALDEQRAMLQRKIALAREAIERLDN